MGYYDDDTGSRMGGQLAFGAVLMGLFFLARWVYHLPWAHWWHWLSTW